MVTDRQFVEIVLLANLHDQLVIIELEYYAYCLAHLLLNRH